MGKVIYSVGLAIFGLQHLQMAIFGHGVGPPWTPGPAIWAAIVGVLLLGFSGAIWTDRRAALVLGLLLLVEAAVAWLPGVVMHPADPTAWTPAFEHIAFAGGAFALAGRSILGRLLFAASMLVFCVLHLVYGNFIASLIPAWFPARYFLAIAVGVGFGAAALAMSVGILGRLGAVCLGCMFLIWVVVLHAPRVIASSFDQDEVTSMVVAFTMAGVAFIVARAFPSMRE